MTISAKIICDSINEYGNRLTTFQLRYPRFIHAELMTHRVFSRNASSSRAIPVAKLIEDIERDPVYPSFWGSNKPGMQAGDELDEYVRVCIDQYHEVFSEWNKKDAWDLARRNAILSAKGFSDAGYHKQIVNRLLEPFSHINVVCTATDYENFYSLRRHKDAQPEIKLLADAMWEAQRTSVVTTKLFHNEWHLPYITDEDWTDLSISYDQITEILLRVSVARCARVSYLTHEGKEPNIIDDLKLYDRLVGSIPLHASPAEHQARPDRIICNNPLTWKNPELHGNLTGWVQYRKTLPNEFING